VILARDFRTARLAACRASAVHTIQLRSIAVAFMPPLSRTVVIALLASVCVAGYA
jgi:hypothetical protein